MRGSLHCATYDETVRCSGRDDGEWIGTIHSGYALDEAEGRVMAAAKANASFR